VSEVPSKKAWLLSIICIAILELILYLLPITKFIMAVATVLAGPLIFFASFKWHLKEGVKPLMPLKPQLTATLELRSPDQGRQTFNLDEKVYDRLFS